VAFKSDVDICGFLERKDGSIMCQFIGAVEACDSLYFLCSSIHVNIASVGNTSSLLVLNVGSLE
jgi:hypothetical protein